MFSIDYITVFDTELASNGDEDTSKQLLLYHVFPNIKRVDETSIPQFSLDNIINGSLLKAHGNQLTNGKLLDLLQISTDSEHYNEMFIDSNEKLGNIGIIQAMHGFYKQNFKQRSRNEAASPQQEKLKDYEMMTIKLSKDKVILVYNYETCLFDQQKKQNIYIALCCRVENNLQAMALEKLLIKSIMNFQFLYGPFELFYGNSIYFTRKLNEFYVSYWNNVLLKNKDSFYKVANYEPMMYKKSEIMNDGGNNSKSFDQLSVQLKNEVLLNEQYFLNIKDILIYQNGETEKKNDGFLMNFSYDNQSIGVLSNWLDEFVDQKRILNNSKQNRDPNAKLDSDGKEEEYFTQKMLHNITLPFQFAYDAVQEVGNMTGVGSSISMLGDFLPKTASSNEAETRPGAIYADHLQTSSRNIGLNGANTIGHLGTMLDDHEQDTQFLKYFVDNKFSSFVKFGDFNARRFNLLIWEYQTIYCVFVVEVEFDIMYEFDLLEELNEKLLHIFDTYNMSTNTECTQQHDFNYYIHNFKTLEKFGSIPDYFPEKKALNEIPKREEGEASSFLKKTTSMWGLSSIFGSSASTDPVEVATAKPLAKKKEHQPHNLFYDIDEPQFNEINKFVWAILSSCNNQLEYQKLVKLENGVFCYVDYKKDEYLLLILKNWLVEPEKGTPSLHKLNQNHKELKLMRSLGQNVVEWFLQNRDIYMSVDS